MRLVGLRVGNGSPRRPVRTPLLSGGRLLQNSRVWTDSPSWITCWNSGNDYVRAMQHPDIEFMWPAPVAGERCLLADIILPVNTKLEEDDIAATSSAASTICSPETQCIEPLAESYSDYEIVCMLADHLGLLKDTPRQEHSDLIKYGWETSRCADSSAGKT